VLRVDKALLDDIIDKDRNAHRRRAAVPGKLTKAVVEAGMTDASRKQVATIPSSKVAVPGTLHASLMARLDRLVLPRR
jgi:hypothetical protein